MRENHRWRPPLSIVDTNGLGIGVMAVGASDDRANRRGTSGADSTRCGTADRCRGPRLNRPPPTTAGEPAKLRTNSHFGTGVLPPIRTLIDPPKRIRQAAALGWLRSPQRERDGSNIRLPDRTLHHEALLVLQQTQNL